MIVKNDEKTTIKTLKTKLIPKTVFYVGFPKNQDFPYYCILQRHVKQIFWTCDKICLKKIIMTF